MVVNIKRVKFKMQKAIKFFQAIQKINIEASLLCLNNQPHNLGFFLDERDTPLLIFIERSSDNQFTEGNLKKMIKNTDFSNFSRKNLKMDIELFDQLSQLSQKIHSRQKWSILNLKTPAIQALLEEGLITQSIKNSAKKISNKL